MHWYVIHTKPRDERRALENLERQGYTCYLPMMAAEKIRQGKIALVDEALFPRYLFIRLGDGMLDKSWHPIRSTLGVSRMVMFGNVPAKVDDALIAALHDREIGRDSTPKRLFSPGEKLRITEGPFVGLEAIYQMSEGEARVMVLIELLSKPTPLRISPTSLRRVG